MEQLDTLYLAYAGYKDMVKEDSFSQRLARSLREDGSAEMEMRDECVAVQWDMEWINAFETAMPFVEKAVEEQRRFLESSAEIRRIDQARKPTPESIHHLAQHSNLIRKVQGEDVIPDRLLIVEREDNYAIYENRFLYTLIQQMLAFLQPRYETGLRMNGQRTLHLWMKQAGKVNQMGISEEISLVFTRHPERPMISEGAMRDMNDLERVEMLLRRTQNIAQLPLMRRLKGSSPVTPPVVRTNVFKGNENFSQALALFEFMQVYQKQGYEILRDEGERVPLSQEQKEEWRALTGLQALLCCEAMEPGLVDLMEERRQRIQAERASQQERAAVAQEQNSRTRVAQARREEMAIRQAEIAKREGIIAEKQRMMEVMQEERAGLQQEIARAALEREKLTRDGEAIRDALRRAEEALEASRLETGQALSRVEQERKQRREDLEQAKQEVRTAERARKEEEQQRVRAEQKMLATERELRAAKEKIAGLQKEMAQIRRETEKEEKKERKTKKVLYKNKKIW